MAGPVVVVAPHPDDETLGCGGTLMRHIAGGDPVYWLIVTNMGGQKGVSQAAVKRRGRQIQAVAGAYGFAGVFNLNLPPARLDTIAKEELISSMGKVFKAVAPMTVYAPFHGDVHSDHTHVFEAVAACTKWFRYPSIQRVLCYETLSETEAGLAGPGMAFVPNSYVDISAHLDKKIEIAKIYAEEMGMFPFPRSVCALRALAQVRGAACGCQAAESFVLMKEIIR